jgi:hypothetical protein
MPYLIIVFVLTAFSLLSFAEEEEKIYRWTDAQGSTHFSHELPDGVEGQVVELNSEPVRVESGKEVYTWKDTEGKIHYGDRPPADQPTEKVDMDANSMSTIRGTVVRPGERALLRDLEHGDGK